MVPMMMMTSLLSFSRRLIGRRRICNIFILLFLLCSGTLYIIIDKVIYNQHMNDVDTDGNVLSDDQIMIVIKDTKNGGKQKEYINKHGVHVIVGQYMGSNVNWNGSPTLSSGE